MEQNNPTTNELVNLDIYVQKLEDEFQFATPFKDKVKKARELEDALLQNKNYWEFNLLFGDMPEDITPIIRIDTDLEYIKNFIRRF